MKIYQITELQIEKFKNKLIKTIIKNDLGISIDELEDAIKELTPKDPGSKKEELKNENHGNTQ